MKEIFRLLRVYQYVKNSFILLPLFFAGRIREWDVVLETVLIALGFSLLASAVYILNDLFDAEQDKLHPVKRDRPVASGKISPSIALVLMSGLVLAGASVILMISPEAGLYCGAYVMLNLVYSGFLKHIPVLDITLISVGFVLRLFIGEAAAKGEAPLSMWIILITFLLALFLALAKRRDDVLLLNEGVKARKSIDGYNLEFINGGMMIMASVTIVAYISYCISPEVIEKFHSDKLFYTVIFVILGILRYMQISFVENKSGSPTRILLKDPFLQLTLAGWIVSFILIIY